MEPQYLNRGTAPTTTADVIAIRPGPPLTGTVTVDGSKNAALPLLAAAAALHVPVYLNNLPDSSDVRVMISLLRDAGFDVGRFPEQAQTALIAPAGTRRPNPELLTAASRIRASYYLVPALLALYGRARLPWPGGCRIGERGMEQHFRVYEAYGDRCTSHRHGYDVEMARMHRDTASVALPFRSRGATIAAALRALVSSCEVRIAKPNLSPEVRGVLDALGMVGWVADVRRELLVLVPPSRGHDRGGAPCARGRDRLLSARPRLPVPSWLGRRLRTIVAGMSSGPSCPHRRGRNLNRHSPSGATTGTVQGRQGGGWRQG